MINTMVTSINTLQKIGEQTDVVLPFSSVDSSKRQHGFWLRRGLFLLVGLSTNFLAQTVNYKNREFAVSHEGKHCHYVFRIPLWD
jgi:hypothetical protein